MVIAMTIGAPPTVASDLELLEALPVAAVVLAPAGRDLRVVQANPAARREAGGPLEGGLGGGQVRALGRAGLAVPARGPPDDAGGVGRGAGVFERRAARHGEGLLATFSDIAARAGAQQQLARREEQLAQAQEM